MTENDIRATMNAALNQVRAAHDGQIPAGSNVAVMGGVMVRVYGPSPIKSNITVQFAYDGRGYSADVGMRSGRLGKIGTYT